jgi:general secretion pathway protein E
MEITLTSDQEEERQLLYLSEKYGLKTSWDLHEYPFVKGRQRILPYQFVKQKKLLPLELDQNILLVAIFDPLDFASLEEISCMSGYRVKEILSSKRVIDSAIEYCYQQSDEEAKEYITNLSGEKEDILDIDNEHEYDLLDQRSDSRVIRLVNMVLAEALQQGASDIHFEPIEMGIVIRYRIDGVLQVRHTPSRDIQNELLTRIKVIAKLDIAEHRLPQDGRIKLRMAGREIDFRVSTVPVVYGERIVLRILDRSQVVLGLDQLGMRSEMLSDIRKMLKASQGIILVTGPTGSGKTTTLYSALSELGSEQVNIMTIEDPVEYKLPKMAQIGVNGKIQLTFATGLRHILRQDPDVIMIGEIRDQETAEIAIQASLTGHLVLSTLHTNDAPSALTRMVDMGVEPYLLSSSLIGVLAQRLVRKICTHCVQSYKPSQEELLDLQLDPGLEGVVDFYKGSGCAHCFSSGYKGRHGIYELMKMSSKMKAQLTKSPDATELYNQAKADGMKSLRLEGAELVLKGITTSSEVIRVTRNMDEI